MLSGSGTRPAPHVHSALSRLPVSPAPGGGTTSQWDSHKIWGIQEGAKLLPSPQATPCPHTFLQGLEETSKDALKALRCCVVRMVRGRLGRLWSFPSSAPFAEAGPILHTLSSSSLLPGDGYKQQKGPRFRSLYGAGWLCYPHLHPPRCNAGWPTHILPPREL